MTTFKEDFTKLRHEKDYFIEELVLIDWKGNEYDFTGHLLDFSYEENIFSGIHASLVAIDAVDYPTLLPIIGEERLRGSFTRQKEDIEGGLHDPIQFDLKIYAMNGRQQDQGSRKRQVYNLYFTSDETYKNASTKIFKAYKGELYSTIVQKVYDEYIRINKPLELEPTLYLQDYIISNERPIGAIKKICGMSIADNDNKVGNYYTFYEDRDKFYFCTLGHLLKRAPRITLRYEVKQVLEQRGEMEHKPRTTDRDIYNVDVFNQSSNFDILGSIQSGEGAGSILSIDPIRRKFALTEYNLNDEYQKFDHVDKAKKFSDGSVMFRYPTTNVQMIITNKDHDTAPYISDKEPNVHPQHAEDYEWHKASHSAQIFRNVTKTRVSGDPRVRAGDVIEFLIPEFLGKTSEKAPEELDKYIQGKYIVISIAHVLKHGDYHMNMELVKDNFFSDIEHRDPIKEYENVI